jgi:hypothetical protein
MEALQKLKVEIPYYLSIALLVIYPKESNQLTTEIPV